MDRTVPAGAAYLLDFIGGIEAPKGYDTIYGNNQNKLPLPITKMTLADVQTEQAEWTKLYKSSAAGRYQFMRNTLSGLIDELNLPLTMRFDANIQDRLGFHLLRRRGYDAFVFGRISKEEFGKRLAQEWASFPVLQATQGAHKYISRGQSFYAGDLLNKSLVRPEAVEVALDGVLERHRANPAAPVVKPPVTKKVAAGAAIGGAVVTGAATSIPAALPSDDPIKSVTDTVSSLQPVVDSVSGIAALGGKVFIFTLVAVTLGFMGYFLYRKFSK